jgi:hypothetical protein
MIECCGVRCDDKQLVEVEDGRVMVSVERHCVRQITLRYGVMSPHPILQGLIGMVLASLGFIPAAHLIEWSLHGGEFLAIEAGLVGLSVVGIWLIATSLRRGYFLEVQEKSSRKRLQLRPAPEAEKLASFVRAVEEAWGVNVARGPGVAE